MRRGEKKVSPFCGSCWQPFLESFFSQASKRSSLGSWEKSWRCRWDANSLKACCTSSSAGLIGRIELRAFWQTSSPQISSHSTGWLLKRSWCCSASAWQLSWVWAQGCSFVGKPQFFPFCWVRSWLGASMLWTRSSGEIKMGEWRVKAKRLTSMRKQQHCCQMS